MTANETAVAKGPVLARRRVRRGAHGALRKLLRDPGAIVGAFALAFVLLLLAVTPWLRLVDPLAVNVPSRLAHFSRAHPLGTDIIGRDMLSRMLYGGRASVALTMAVTAITTLIGLVIGVVAGLRGGFIDSVFMRTVEIIQSVPFIIVIMVMVKLVGGGQGTLVLILAALGWTGQARVVRAATLSLREREFVKSCQGLGATRRRVAIRHIVPNLLGPVVVVATLEVGRILLTISTLSFLGFGSRPPQPEWGSMLADARDQFFTAPRLLVIPGVAIFIVALAANLFGEGLRDAFEVGKAGS